MTASKFIIGPLFVELTLGTEKKNYHDYEWHPFKREFNITAAIELEPAPLFTGRTGYKRADGEMSTRITFADGSKHLVEETSDEIKELTLKAAKELTKALKP